MTVLHHDSDSGSLGPRAFTQRAHVLSSEAGEPADGLTSVGVDSGPRDGWIHTHTARAERLSGPKRTTGAGNVADEDLTHGGLS
jgi:hypothetical protein